MKESPRLPIGALRSVDLPREVSSTTGSQPRGNLMPPKKAHPARPETAHPRAAVLIPALHLGRLDAETGTISDDQQLGSIGLLLMLSPR